jgi:hypothetical protein
MRRKSFPFITYLFVIALQGVPALAQLPSDTDSQLTLTEPAAVEVVESLSKAIDDVSGRVRECVSTKEAPAQLCFCRYPQEVNRLRSQYETALVKFPTWKAKVLNWSTPGRRESRSVSMPGLANQFRQECPK